METSQAAKSSEKRPPSPANIRTLISSLCAEIGARIAWVKCPACGKEWSKLKDSGECWDCDEKKGADAKRKTAIRAKLLRMFGSNAGLLALSFQNWMHVPGAVEAHDYANAFDPAKDNAYFVGPSGRGKTHLAYAMAQKWAGLGKSAEILTVRQLVNRFRLAKPDEETERSDALANADVLVIDDLGKVANSEFALDILTDIVGRRGMMEKNGLIVTSNLTLDHLAQKNQDDRLSSRLAGMCRIVRIQTEKDYRLERRT